MRTFMIVTVIALTAACASKHSTSENACTFQEIHFGSAGGFTGMATEYLLNADGQVYRVYSDSSAYMHSIEKPVLSTVDEALKNINFKEINRLETGNMTYFVEVFYPEQSHKVTWSDESEADDLKTLYKILAQTLNQK